jgi:predicted Zn-dependent protease
VLIAFNTVAENPGLAGGVAGRGGSSWIELPGQPRVYVSGTVSVDVEWFTAAQFTPGLGVAAVESVVLHELGHVVGLDHVDDRTQLMAPEGGPVRDYQDGDRSGLALLGAGECAPGV